MLNNELPTPVSFKVGIYTIDIDGEYREYFKYRSYFEKNAIKHGDAICDYFKEEIHSYDDVYEKGILMYKKIVAEMIEFTVEKMIKKGVDYVSEERFEVIWQKYYDIDKHFKFILDMDRKMNETIEDIARYRSVSRASRGKWVGGGFGIGGAIKGALTASAMNIGTSMARGVGDILTNSSDRRKIERFKEQAFEEFKNNFMQCLWTATREAIYEMFECSYAILLNEEKIIEFYYDEEKITGRAQNIRKQYQMKKITKDEALGGLIKCKEQYPYHMWYDLFIYEIEPKMKQDLVEVSKFFGFVKDLERCFDSLETNGLWSNFEYHKI